MASSAIDPQDTSHLKRGKVVEMVFSLEVFLQELEDIINSNNMDAGEKLRDLIIRVQDAREMTKPLTALPLCVACDGKGTVGELGSYDRPIRVTCSHCYGTGREGGDNIQYARWWED